MSTEYLIDEFVESAKRKKAKKNCLAALSEISENLRPIGYYLLDSTKKGKKRNFSNYSYHEKHVKLKNYAIKRFNKLSNDERIAVLNCIVPSISQELVLAYAELLSRPSLNHHSGGVRQQYPAQSNQSSEHAIEWLANVVVQLYKIDPAVLTPAWLMIHENGFHYYTRGYGFFPIYTAMMEQDESGGSEIFDLMQEIVNGNHEVGTVSRSIILSLMCSNDIRCWNLVEQLLIAASREEGLRKSIIDGLHVASEGAFIKIARTIIEHKLTRFNSIAAGISIAFGILPGTLTQTKLIQFVELALREYEATDNTVEGREFDTPQHLHCALWAIGTRSISEAIDASASYVNHKKVNLRFAALSYLARVNQQVPVSEVLKFIHDEDERVRYTAIRLLRWVALPTEKRNSSPSLSDDEFSFLKDLMLEAPKKRVVLKPALWPEEEISFSKSTITDSLVRLTINNTPDKLLPIKKEIGADHRYNVFYQLVNSKNWSPDVRSAIVEGVGDLSEYIGSCCAEALGAVSLTQDEILNLEQRLTRKSTALRTEIVKLLINRDDSDVLASADRLLGDKNANKMMAGLELLRQMAEKNRSREACLNKAKIWKEKRSKISAEGKSQLDAILTSAETDLTLSNALGLLSESYSPDIYTPKNIEVELFTENTVELVHSLYTLYEDNLEQEFESTNANGEVDKQLLSDSSDFWFFDGTDPQLSEKFKTVTGYHLWANWAESAQEKMGESFPIELWRAVKLTYLMQLGGKGKIRKLIHSNDINFDLSSFDSILSSIKNDNIVTVHFILQWVHAIYPDDRVADLVMDCFERTLSRLTKKDFQSMRNSEKYIDHKDCRQDFDSELSAHFDELIELRDLTKVQKIRRYTLINYLRLPNKDTVPGRMSGRHLLQGFEFNLATVEDVIATLICEPKFNYSYFRTLSEISVLQNQNYYQKLIQQRPELENAVHSCINAIVSVELNRGEKATCATAAAWSLQAIYGVQYLIDILSTMGKSAFKPCRNHRSDDADKITTLTRLAKVCFPGQSESEKHIVSKLTSIYSNGVISEEKLLQLGFLAPQWIPYIESVLKWPSCAEGYYWFFAHMSYISSDLSDSVLAEQSEDDEEVDENEADGHRNYRKNRWNRMIEQRSIVSSSDRHKGVVDVQWYHTVKSNFTAEQWNAIAGAARYASSPADAKRAVFLSEVLEGTADTKTLIEGIRKRHLKENVRLLGLLPLEKNETEDLQNRYKILNEYRLYASKLSGLTKPDAMQACDIGFDNLAMTAGYADPMRLSWRLESELSADLKTGVIQERDGDVKLTLEYKASGELSLTISRADKELKNLPPAQKKNKKMIALRERHKELKKQIARTKKSLESAMINSEEFSGRELKALKSHYLLWPLLQNFVWIGPNGLVQLNASGRKVSNLQGKSTTIKVNDIYRIAHPVDLLASGEWSEWQQDLFESQRAQPFKQLFRELYVPTSAEKKGKKTSTRFQNQQVQPKQAGALLGSRLWHTRYGIWKAFPTLGFSACLNVDESDGWGEFSAWTIEDVSFQRHDKHETIALKDVNPIIFSETMRDIDLVVSVAHKGEVDPEASASTIDMRKSLIQATVDFLSLDNITLKSSNVLISGTRGKYSVHLGSGVVHRLPGKHVCMVTVEAQQRGRLFLPFADNDPKTAEVLTKVLLLARDKDIKDPTILEQLRAA